MTKKEVLEKISKEKIIEDIVNGIAKSKDDQLKDLIQDMYMLLLEKDEEFVVNLYESGEIKFYLTRVALNNIRSTSGPFWCKYKRFMNKCSELIEDYADSKN